MSYRSASITLVAFATKQTQRYDAIKLGLVQTQKRKKKTLERQGGNSKHGARQTAKVRRSRSFHGSSLFLPLLGFFVVSSSIYKHSGSQTSENSEQSRIHKGKGNCEPSLAAPESRSFSLEQPGQQSREEEEEERHGRR